MKMFSNKITLLVIFISLHQNILAQDESESVKGLRKELFINRNYDKYSFPVKDHKQAVNVSVYVRILKIIDLHIKTQVLDLNAYVKMYWLDEHLSWNPSEFGGQTQIVVSSDLVWKPDITITNGPNAYRFESNIKKSTLWLHSDGQVEFDPPGQMKTFCMTDLTYYPNDIQVCRVILESYYKYNYVDFKTYEHQNITKYFRGFVRYKNTQWELTKVESSKKIQTFNSGANPGTFARINCYLTLERRHPLLYYFIKTPIFVAIVLSIVMMTYPPNSIKRFKLSALSLLVLFAVLLFLVNRIGFVGNKGIPKIVSKTSITMVFIAVLIFCSILLNMMFNSTGSLPYFISVVIRNPLMKIIGIGDYLIDLTIKEGTDSGIMIAIRDKTLTENQNQWILFTLLLDKIILLAYLLFIISVYT